MAVPYAVSDIPGPLAYEHQNAGGATDLKTLLNLFAKDSSSTATARKCDTAGAGEAAVGIVFDITDGKRASVAGPGVTTFLQVDGSGTAIKPGDPLKSNAAGKGVKATAGDAFYAVALEYAGDARTILVVVQFGEVASNAGAGYELDAASPATISDADLAPVVLYTFEGNTAGAQTLNIPAAGAGNKGKAIAVKKKHATAGAITITPASGTIEGSATHATIDAQGDRAIFVSDGNGNWVMIASNIA